MMKLAILVAPYMTRTKREERELYDAKRELLSIGWLPVFLPDTLGDVLDDHKTPDRLRGLAASEFFCRTLAGYPDVEMVVVGDRMTEGMKGDVTAWLNAGGPAPANVVEITKEEDHGRDD